MELQLVSFEQAKVLKELGFPDVDDTRYYYDIEGNCIPYLDYAFHRMFHCQAYSLELVAKWLRERKGIIVCPSSKPCCNETLYTIPHILDAEGNYLGSLGAKIFNTFEEALSAGIDEAIEMLRKRN